MNPVVEELTKNWNNAGIQQGDIVLVHSDITRTYRKYYGKITVDDILQSFLNAIGKDGTGMLFFPTFNFDFSTYSPNGFFDFYKTKSQMGALTERARNKWGRCNGHPVYSFTCSRPLNFVDNVDAFGPNSPFALLENGKIAVLDLEENESMTYYHYIEYLFQNLVDWRYLKKFKGLYVKESSTSKYGVVHNNVKNKEYEIFVRKSKTITQVNPMGEILWEKKVWKGCRPKQGHGLRVAKVFDIFSEVSDVIIGRKAEGILYLKEK